PGVPGLAADAGQRQRRAVRQPAALAPGHAPGDGTLCVVPRPRPVLRLAGGQGVAAAAPRVRAGAIAHVLTEPEPDRAAVEVPAPAGVEPVAPVVRGDAGGGV